VIRNIRQIRREGVTLRKKRAHLWLSWRGACGVQNLWIVVKISEANAGGEEKSCGIKEAFLLNKKDGFAALGRAL